MSSSLPVPEEIVAHILNLLVQPSSEPPAVWTSSSPSDSLSHYLPALLVSRTFCRIAKPMLYRSVHLRTKAQADKLADAVCGEPGLGMCIRSLRVDGPAAGGAFERIMNCINTAPLLSGNSDGDVRPLDLLDMKMDGERDEVIELENLNCFVKALGAVRGARQLVVRKSGYLTKESTCWALYELSEVITGWSCLECVDFRYKIQPMSVTAAQKFNGNTPAKSPSQISRFEFASEIERHADGIMRHGFVDPVARALSRLPSLKVVRALMPAVWNSFLLDVSKNPSLERIELLDGSEDKLALHLIDYTRTSTPVFRGRGRGLSDVASSSSSAPAPLPVIQSSSTINYERIEASIKLMEKITLAGSYRDVPEDALPTEPVMPDLMPPPGPSSLYVRQAAKHPRLHSLILAGRRHVFLERMKQRSSSSFQSVKPHSPLSSGTSTATNRSRANTAIPSASNSTL